MKLPVDDGTVDVMDCENPADLLAALLGKLGGTASVSKLCKVCTHTSLVPRL